MILHMIILQESLMENCMSINIQVPNYPQAQQVQPAQSYQQGVQSVQPNHMGGNYNPHQQNAQNVQQVPYDNYNQIIQPVEENTSKSVTFIADGISLDIMKECDPIHINTLINMGIKLAKDHSFYKQFLVNKDNYNLKGSTISAEESSNSNHTNSNVVGSPIGNVGNINPIQPTQPIQQNVQMHASTPAGKVQDSLDFTKLFD